MKKITFLFLFVLVFHMGFTQHSMHADPSPSIVPPGSSALTATPTDFATLYDVLNDDFLSVENSDFLSINNIFSYNANFYCGDRGPGNVLFVANDDDKSLYSVDINTGTVTLVNPITAYMAGHTFTSMSYHNPTNTMYFGTSNGSQSWLYVLNASTGVLTPIGQITNCDILIDFAVNNNGELFGIDINLDNLLRINTSTAAGTIIGPVGINANFAQSMDFDDATNTLYWAAYASGGSFRTINSTTGMSTEIRPASSEMTVLSIGSAATVPLNIFAILSIFILSGSIIVFRFFKK